MRITQTILKEYLETDAQIKALESRKNKIREEILKQEKEVFSVGSFAVSIIESTRAIPLPVNKIREIIGDATDKILQNVVSRRVVVKELQ